uniref:Antimicrobial peptide 1 n=1 Tax=Xenopus tropicalis TaxID=8364 RepID=XT1_XENTR|nr:RecName: Full=Antimicrobial peptide 1; AltName: Full=XT-1 [Xenopus tropicalis]
GFLGPLLKLAAKGVAKVIPHLIPSRQQ